MLPGECVYPVSRQGWRGEGVRGRTPSQRTSRSVSFEWKVPLSEDLAEDHSYALLIRVWFEDEADFRARVTALASRPEQGQPRSGVTVAAATTPREVVRAVGEWLGELMRPGAYPIDGG